MSAENGIKEGSLRASYLAHILQHQFGRSVREVVFHPKPRNEPPEFKVTTYREFPKPWFEDHAGINGVQGINKIKNSLGILRGPEHEISEFIISADRLPEPVPTHMQFFKIAEEQAPVRIIGANFINESYVVSFPSRSPESDKVFVQPTISRQPFANWLGVDKNLLDHGLQYTIKIPRRHIMDFLAKNHIA